MEERLHILVEPSFQLELLDVRMHSCTSRMREYDLPDGVSRSGSCARISLPFRDPAHKYTYTIVAQMYKWAFVIHFEN